MKLPALPSETKLIVGGVIVAGLLAWWFIQKGNAKAVGGAIGGAAVDLITGTVGGVVHGAGQVIADNPAAFVPSDPANLVYSGINDAGSAVTSDQNFSLGAWLYNVTH
jgi:hypothetical protein